MLRERPDLDRVVRATWRVARFSPSAACHRRMEAPTWGRGSVWGVTGCERGPPVSVIG